MAEKCRVTIDGIPIEVDKGTTVLQAARQIGGDIVPPAMCYYSKLENSGGKCRTCLIKVSKGSEKDPRPMPKLVASCKTQVMDGMEVQNITSQEVLEARRGIVELLLINHPLDCPVCDQAGECDLQDLSYKHGLEKTRYNYDRRTFEAIDIGKYIKLHMNRCIMCYRCIHVADQITDKRVHGVLSRGDKTEIGTYIEASVSNNFSGNVIDVCPVGALTDKTYRFKNKVWFSKPVYAHRDCDMCCGKVTLWYKGEDVIRVTARKDKYGEVEEFICNTCRYETKATTDWIIEKPAFVDNHSVINSNHYESSTPPPVLKENTQLQEKNKKLYSKGIRFLSK